MSRMPWLAKRLSRELLAVGLAMLDGSYWATSIYDDQNFPAPPDCNAEGC